MKIKQIILTLLMVGIVDQINGDVISIEYKKYGKTEHTKVSLSQSACVPSEGQKVHFFEDYKVVTCEDQ